LLIAENFLVCLLGQRRQKKVLYNHAVKEKSKVERGMRREKRNLAPRRVAATRCGVAALRRCGVAALRRCGVAAFGPKKKGASRRSSTGLDRECYVSRHLPQLLIYIYTYMKVMYDLAIEELRAGSASRHQPSLSAR
jgi:hypothetical protein